MRATTSPAGLLGLVALAAALAACPDAPPVVPPSGCDAARPCAGGFTCEAGACVAIEGTACSATQPCAAGLDCTAGACAPRPPMTIERVLPASGAATGGAAVRISGRRFVENVRVHFGSNEATDVRLLSDSQLSARTPAATPGRVDVKVTAPDGSTATLRAGFSYFDASTTGPQPAITSLTPGTGPAEGGTRGLVAGSGFVEGASVLFGSTAAVQAKVLDAGRIVFVTPPLPAGAVDVTVTNPDGRSDRRESAFTFHALPGAPPSITGVEPAVAPPGRELQLAVSGTGFATGAQVFVGDLPATEVAVESAARLVATVPAMEPGTYAVAVVNADGRTGVREDAFTVAQPACDDAVRNGTESDLDCGGGCAPCAMGLRCGTEDDCAAGSICGTEGTCVAGCSSTHACPEGEACVVSRCELPPAISGFSPGEGPVGTRVTIDGAHFGAEQLLGAVLFGGVRTSTVESWADDRIVVKVPAGANTGRVEVETPAGTATSATDFGVTVPSCSTHALELSTDASQPTGWIHVANTPAISVTGPMTLEAWVRPSVGTGTQTILRKEQQYALELVDGRLSASIYTTSGGWIEARTTAAVATARWTHVAATWDGWRLRAFVDGVPLASTPASGLVHASAHDLAIGGTARFFGLIDEVRVSRTVRYAAAGFAPPAALLASDDATALLLRFDEEPGVTLVQDASGAALTGTVQGTVGFASATASLACGPSIADVRPRSGGAGTTVTIHGAGFGASRGQGTVSFEGAAVAAGDYVSWSDAKLVVKAPAGGATGRVVVAAASGSARSGLDFAYQACDPLSLQLVGTLAGGGTARAIVANNASLHARQEVTIEAFVYPTEIVPGSRDLVRKEQAYALTLESGRLRGAIYTTSGGWVQVDATAPLALDAWTHVAMSYDGSALRLFAGGKASGTIAVSGFVNESYHDLAVGGAPGGLDELRLSRIARYTGDFLPPAGPFVADDATIGLWHFDDGEAATLFADAGAHHNDLLADGAARLWTHAALGCGPAIADVVPRAAAAGATVRVVGSGFGASPGTVTLDGAPLEVATWSAGELVVRVPAGANGAITVTTADGARASSGFAVTALGCLGRSLQLPATPTGSASALATIANDSRLALKTRFTLEAWVRPSAASAENTILRKEQQYAMALRNGRLSAQLYTQSGGWSAWTTGGPVEAGRWSHVAVVYDGWSLRTFVDGVQTSSDRISGLVNQSYHDLAIGAYPQFYGRIDEVRVSATVRYTGAFTPPAGPFAPDADTHVLLHFDEAPGQSSASDASAQGFVAQFQGPVLTGRDTASVSCAAVIGDVSPRVGGEGTTVTVTGRGFGGAATVAFGGTPVEPSAYVSRDDGRLVVRAPAGGRTGRVTVTAGGTAVPSGVDFVYSPCGGSALQLPYGSTGGANGQAIAPNGPSLAGGDRLTVEAWYMPTSAVTGEQAFVAKEQQFALANRNGRLAARVYTPSGGWSDWATGEALSLGAWQHVALSYDGAALRVFQNGRLTREAALSGTVHTSYHDVQVGSAWGQLEEVRISSLARYRRDFTPPSGPFASDAWTQALWHFDEAPTTTRLRDASANGNDLSTTGAVELWPSDLLGCGPAVNDGPVRGAPTGGGEVRLAGRGFGSTAGTVTQGGTTLRVVSWTDTEIVVEIPAGASGPLTITTAGGLAATTGNELPALSCEALALQLPQTPTGAGQGYLRVTNHASLHVTTRLTLEAWVYPTVATGDASIVHKEQSYALRLSNGRLQANLYTPSGGWVGWRGTASVTPSKWSHVAAVYDGWSIRTYVDGVLASDDHVSGTVNGGYHDLTIGTGGGQFYGAIDEVRISARDRYTGARFTPAPRLPADADTRLLLHLDDGALVTSAADASTHANTATFVGASLDLVPHAGAPACPPVPVDVSPRVGGASTSVTIRGSGFGASRGTSRIEFGGAAVGDADYVSWSDSSVVVRAPAAGSTGRVTLVTASGSHATPIDFRYAPCAGYALQLPWNATGAGQGYFVAPHGPSLAGDSPLTVEAWVFASTGGGTAEQTLIQKEQQYALALQNGILRARVYTVAGGWSSWAGTAVLPRDRWAHVAMSWDGSTLRTFVDGAPAGQAAVTGVLNSSYQDLAIGAHGQFYGQIDEVRISSVARYTGPFNVPVNPFTADGSTRALYHFDDGADATLVADATGVNPASATGAATTWVSTAPLTCEQR